MENSNIDKLMELKQLYEQGVLTKEEMEAEKAKIMGVSTPKPNLPNTDSTPVITSEQVESISDQAEKKHFIKIVLGVASVIVIIIVGCVGFYLLNQKKSAMNPMEDNELSQIPADDSIYIGCVKNWDNMHNHKGFGVSENCPYSETVYFFGTKMSGKEAANAKQKAVIANTDYKQESKNIKVTRISDKLVVCDFEKHTHSKGKSKVHFGSYLFLNNEGGIWKIIEESDLESDNNLQKKRERKSSDKINQPITLQFIREYCDYLKLPYDYWMNVRNEIEEHNLNVHTREGSDFDITPYVSRGRVVMNNKYKQGNDILENFTHYYNYIGFCDAIGRIKDVWNIVPVRIENNDEYESPLFQFYYEGIDLDNIIITAQYIEDDFDGNNKHHYKFVRNDNKKEVPFDLVSY